MFEKEAEEYATDCKKEFHTSYGACLHSFKDGAEFGYNKGLEAGRPKWHKVADGDLPKIGKPCLVYLANDSVITARLREDNVWTTNGCNAFENVIAWCEIPDFEEEVKECRT